MTLYLRFFVADNVTNVILGYKTPRSIGKINGLSVNASKKFAAYPGREKAAVVSLLRLPDARGALDAAGRFTPDEAVVLTRDGTRLN